MELVVKTPFENYRIGDVVTDAAEVERLFTSPFVTRRQATAKPAPQRPAAPVFAPVAPAPAAADKE